MSADPRLVDYLELRAGAALDRDDLDAMAGPGAATCVFVDWVAIGDAMALVAIRAGEDPVLVPLAASTGAIRAFVAENLAPQSFRSTLRDAPELLRACDALIAPLAGLSTRDDLLMLCPAGPLHAIPLHALELDGEPLIAHNRVAYCPSLGVLRQCLARGEGRGPLTAALFGDPNDDRDEAARIVQDLAARLGTTPLLGGDVTRAAFAATVAGRDLVHFHGHARHDRRDPLGSHLVLADGTLTAREIFGLRDLRAGLVTLAACESAASVVATGDEPLGLIPAFLYAGAGSVLATLWKVQARSAAQMMGHFYDALGSEGIDKAQLLREAVLDVRATAGLEAPYHWAPFVLYGDWH
jgi:CHAT domain-containing protein